MAVGHFCGNLGAAPWGASLSVEKRGGNDLDRDICGAGAWLSSSVRSLLVRQHKTQVKKNGSPSSVCSHTLVFRSWSAATATAASSK